MVYLLLVGVFLFQTGFLIGPIIPGNPLLFAAGLMANPANGRLDLTMVILCTGIGALGGNMLNYQQGYAAGPAFKRNEKWRTQIESAEAFFARHGSRTVIFAVFVPFIRAFVPFVAGMTRMSLRAFSLSSLVGAFGWTATWSVIGFELGKVPEVAQNANKIVFGIVGIVAIVAIIKAISMRRKGPKE